MEKKFYILLSLLFGLISVLSLFNPGLPPTHDGEYHVIRFYEFDKAFRDGSLYPRWAPDLNNGFGVPLFNFVYPLPNFASLILHFFGFSFIDSFKLSMIIASIIGALFFYLWSRKFWGDLGGIISSVFYSFSPYHLLDVYVRGVVGEVWALGLFPAFLWSITIFIKERKQVFAVLSAVILSLIIFSHNILAVMFFGFALLYAVFLIWIEKRSDLLPKIFGVFALSLGMSALFWGPAFLETKFTVGLRIFDYASHFPDFFQLIFPSWGSGFSTGSPTDQLSYQIGVANLIAIFISFLMLRSNDKNQQKIALFFLGCFFFVFFLILRASLPIWKIVPLMDYFQFPWRFLSLEILFASFLAGSLVRLPKPKITTIILIILAVLFSWGYIKAPYHHLRSDSYYTSRSNFIDGTNSIGDSFNTIWVKDLEKQPERLVLKGDGILNVESIKTAKYIASADLENPGRLQINTAYFPGWNVYINGRKSTVDIEDNGSFSVKLPSGQHNIAIVFERTNIRIFSEIVSILSLVIALLMLSRFARIKR